jgi:hypothetical protein
MSVSLSYPAGVLRDTARGAERKVLLRMRDHKDYRAFAEFMMRSLHADQLKTVLHQSPDDFLAVPLHAQIYTHFQIKVKATGEKSGLPDQLKASKPETVSGLF